MRTAQSTIDAINLEGDIDCRDRRSNRIGREGEGESVQSMTATRMHALVDKVPIAILAADQSGTCIFWTVVVDKCPLWFLHLGADCVGNTTRKKERCPQASGPK